MRIHRLTFVAGFCVIASAVAHGETIPVHATLDAASEVPPKNSPGKGTLDGSLDTASKTLTYTVTYSGLTGPATMAHFHGPAAPGANAGVVIPLPNPASPIKGSAKLTDEQDQELRDGKMYVNVHTAANPGGEIRGQVTASK